MFDERRKSVGNPAALEKIATKVRAKKAKIEKIKTEAEASGVILLLEKLCQDYELDDVERDIVICLFANQFRQKVYVVDTSGKDLLYGVLADGVEVMMNRQILSPKGRLLKTGIVQIMKPVRGSENPDVFMLGGLCLGEKLVAYLLGEVETWEEGTRKTTGDGFKLLELPKGGKG